MGNERIKRPLSPVHSLPRLLLLGLCFLAGIIFGQVLAGRVPAETGAELNRYLEDYVRLGGQSGWSAAAALSAVVIYFRYPLLAFVLGFAPSGWWCCPCLRWPMGSFCPSPCAASRRPSAPTGCYWLWQCSASGAR